MKKRYLILILIFLSFISIFIGVSDIKISDLFLLDNEKVNILLISRIPRLISIITAGMAMSVSGIVMQQISNNKFISPTTAATIDSAKFGVLVSMLIFTGATLFQKMVVSFIFSILGTVIFMKILKAIKLKNSIFIPLIGIMLGNVISSTTDFFAYKYDLIQNMNSFLQGDFSSVLKGNYELILFTIPILSFGFLYANKFTIVGMGEDIATNLGIKFNTVINVGVLIVAVMSSLVVITVGSIPYVGLIIPNIVSIKLGDNLSKNLGVTALIGGIFVLACDILSRIIIYPYEIPISLTVGIIGSFTFLYLLFRRQRYGS